MIDIIHIIVICIIFLILINVEALHHHITHNTSDIVFKPILMTLSSINTSLFWKNLSESQMIDIISEAERQLKIFIYPIPEYAKLQGTSDFDLVPHFYTE